MSGASPLGASGTLGGTKTVQVVKKKREAQAVKGSSDEDEEWFAEQDRGGLASGSGTDAGKSPGRDGAESPGGGPPLAGGASSRHKYKKYWSQLLGCHIMAERKKRKPKIMVMCDLFGMYLKDNTAYSKEERLDMIKIVTLLMRKGGLVKSRAPIAESVRQRVAAERRQFRFGEDCTDIIRAQKKKNAAVMQFVSIEKNVTTEYIKGIDERDRKRRKREQLKEAAAKMGMTLEEFEAARAKTRPPKENDKGAQKSPIRKAGSPLRGGQSPVRQMPSSPPPPHTESPDHFARSPDASQTGEGDHATGADSPQRQLPRMAAIIRGDTFQTSIRGHMKEDRFHNPATNLQLYSLATAKVLAVLGYTDGKREDSFAENTAEEDAELRTTLVAHMEKVAGELLEAAQVR